MRTSGNFTFDGEQFQLDRYPATEQTSLQAWNAADELLLGFAKSRTGNIAIYGDTFGTLSVCLHSASPTVILCAQSQKKAIDLNMMKNHGTGLSHRTAFPLDKLPCAFHSMLIRIPKSLDLFELYLQQASSYLEDGGQVACGFMTKYFSAGHLTLASRYFNVVEQSRAERKARLLFLSSPKDEAQHKPLINTHVTPWGKRLHQYYGVFSADHIDYASLFLAQHLSVTAADATVLDLAAGSGVLASAVMRDLPSANAYLVDDSWLAVESARLNIPESTCIWDDTLDQFSDAMFDLIVCNPPFHFGHETNIEVSLALFAQAARCLKKTGRFLVVANRHLNYAVHLSKIFTKVDTVAENEKYVIYQSRL